MAPGVWEGGIECARSLGASCFRGRPSRPGRSPQVGSGGTRPARGKEVPCAFPQDRLLVRVAGRSPRRGCRRLEELVARMTAQLPPAVETPLGAVSRPDPRCVYEPPSGRPDRWIMKQVLVTLVRDRLLGLALDGVGGAVRRQAVDVRRATRPKAASHVG